MSIIASEIEKAMSNLEESKEGEITASFTFSDEFVGFKGHFIGKPILPGVCKLQMVKTMLSVSHDRNVIIEEVLLTKFFTPVSSGETLFVRCSDKNNLAEVLIVRGDEKIAKIKLKYSLVD